MPNHALGVVVILVGSAILLFRKKYARGIYEGGRIFVKAGGTLFEAERLVTAFGLTVLVVGILVFLGVLH